MNPDQTLEDEQDFELEIVDDTPEADRGKELLPPEKENVEDLSDEELEGYSDGVRKRIKELTFRVHDQRRKAEAAQRERDEAARVAQAAIQRLNAERTNTHAFERFGVDQAKNRFEAEVNQARADLKQAYETGDSDKLADAQVRLSRASTALSQFENYEPPEPEPIEYRPPQPQRGGDPRASQDFESWRQKNDWFGSDPVKTATAMGYHAMIAEQYPDAVGTPQYYAEIDRLMGEAFPANKHEQSPNNSPRDGARTPPVTPVHRNSDREPAANRGKRKVTLTHSQLAVARRLGLTPQQYAEGLLEMEQNQ